MPKHYTFRKGKLKNPYLAGSSPVRKAGAKALYGLAQVAFGQGNIAQARQQAQESLAIFEEIGHVEAAEVKEWLAGLPTDEKLSRSKPVSG